MTDGTDSTIELVGLSIKTADLLKCALTQNQHSGQVIVIFPTELILVTIYGTETFSLEPIGFKDLLDERKSVFRQLLWTKTGGRFCRGLVFVLTTLGNLHAFDLVGHYRRPVWKKVAAWTKGGFTCFSSADHFVVAGGNDGMLYLLDMKLEKLSTLKLDAPIISIDCDAETIMYATTTSIGMAEIRDSRLMAKKVLCIDLTLEKCLLCAKKRIYTLGNEYNGGITTKSPIIGFNLDDPGTRIYTHDGAIYGSDGMVVETFSGNFLAVLDTSLGLVLLSQPDRNSTKLSLSIKRQMPIYRDEMAVGLVDSIRSKRSRCYVCLGLACKVHLFDVCPVTRAPVYPPRAHRCFVCGVVYAHSVDACTRCGPTLHHPLAYVSKQDLPSSVSSGE